MGDTAPIAAWWLGPPPPPRITQLTRLLLAAVLAAMSAWLWGCLGGLRLSPKPSADGASNDTGALFNWHPTLLTIAFPLLMGEAILAYRAPLLNTRGDRGAAKAYHAALQAAALVCVVLGVTAAFKSHTLKKPVPIPNLYSSHSWLGLAVLALLAAQFGAGVAAYLWPKLALPQRRALGPIHAFFGKATFAAGLATMAAGIQEKQTFIQVFGKPPSLHVAVMWLPCLIQVLLLLTALLVLFHHAPPAAPTPAAARRQQYAEGGSPEGGEAGLLVGAQLSESDALPPELDSRHVA